MVSRHLGQLFRRLDRRTQRRIKRLRKRWNRLRKRLRGLIRKAYAVYNRRYRPTYRSQLSRIPARDELPAVLEARGLLGTAAEIGVKQGKFSELLLEQWPGRKLVSIDPWVAAEPDEYVDRANVSQDEHERYYDETRDRLSRFGERSEIWRLTSVEAAARVPDASLDFIYIDARHDYVSVLEDLESWFPKLRPGGIISGHDYANGHFPSGEFGVKQAVDEFFAERSLTVYVTRGRSPVEMFPSWIVEAPRA